MLGETCVARLDIQANALLGALVCLLHVAEVFGNAALHLPLCEEADVPAFLLYHCRFGKSFVYLSPCALALPWFFPCFR